MSLVAPHGTKKELVSRLLGDSARAREIDRARGMNRVQVSAREAGDILMIGIGAFSPLIGFMGRDEYESVLADMRLASSDPGVLWPLPVTLAVESPDFAVGDEIALYEGDLLLATMRVEEIYEVDKKRECEAVYMGQGTRNSEEFWRLADEEHPGVRQVMASGRYYVAGPVVVLSEKDFRQRYGDAYLTPADARKLFADRGWQDIAAFQTRKPMHRSQEYFCKVAQELVDGLFIHAVVGSPAADEVDAEIRFACYQALVENYFNRERTVLGVLPLEMRYAGPREALLHAIIRQNFGCSQILIGRDHAGVGDFYGLFEAQAIFDTLWEDALVIRPIKIDWTFWSKKNGGMASLKTAPTDDPEDRVVLSGSKFRWMLHQRRAGEVPPEFSRPEVLRILEKYFSRLSATKTR